MKLKRRLQGSERGADVRMVQRALNRWVDGRVTVPVTGVYDQRTRDRMVAFQLAESVRPADGSMEQATLDKLAPFFDRYGRYRYRLFRPPPAVPKLGPIVRGGKSLLDVSLTHNTDGVPGYPAFDDGWLYGREVIAPEALVVTGQSGAQGGDAFYAQGASKLRYWIGHVDRAPYTGKKFRQGERMATIAYLLPHEGGPHVHCGIDARALTGTTLLYGQTGRGPDYTYGSPTVGEQLRKAVG